MDWLACKNSGRITKRSRGTKQASQHTTSANKSYHKHSVLPPITLRASIDAAIHEQMVNEGGGTAINFDILIGPAQTEDHMDQRPPTTWKSATSTTCRGKATEYAGPSPLLHRRSGKETDSAACLEFARGSYNPAAPRKTTT